MSPNAVEITIDCVCAPCMIAHFLVQYAKSPDPVNKAYLVTPSELYKSFRQWVDRAREVADESGVDVDVPSQNRFGRILYRDFRFRRQMDNRSHSNAYLFVDLIGAHVNKYVLEQLDKHREGSTHESVVPKERKPGGLHTFWARPELDEWLKQLHGAKKTELINDLLLEGLLGKSAYVELKTLLQFVRAEAERDELCGLLEPVLSKFLSKQQAGARQS